MSEEHVTAGPPRKDTRGSRQRVAPGVFTRSGKYLIAYVDGSGREHVETVGAIRRPGQRSGLTLKDAIAIRESKRVKLRSGEEVAPVRLTLSEVWNDYEQSLDARVASGELAPRTVELYRQRWAHLAEPLGRIRVQELRASHVASLLADLRATGLAPWSLQGTYSLLSAILTHAIVRGWLSSSPLQRLSKSEKPKPRNQRRVRLLEPTELAAVIAATTPRWRPLFVLISHTGLRISEALGLTWANVDTENGVIRIERQLDRSGELARLKTERSRRTVPMSTELKRTLLAHKLASGRPAGDAFVFASATGAAPSYRNTARAFSAALEQAGISWDATTERLSLHNLRHGAASALIRSGVDPVRVAGLLGDRVEMVMSTYAREWEAAKKDENLGDVLAGALSV